MTYIPVNKISGIKLALTKIPGNAGKNITSALAFNKTYSIYITNINNISDKLFKLLLETVYFLVVII